MVLGGHQAWFPFRRESGNRGRTPAWDRVSCGLLGPACFRILPGCIGTVGRYAHGMRMELTDWRAWLNGILAEFNCQTGTLHVTESDGRTLRLVAQVGVPSILLDKITSIPFGKGIAGAAAATREPVELCNLQQDLGGVARPDARQTGVSGSLAVPVFSRDGSRVIGTLGVGMMEPHDFSDGEKARLAEVAGSVAPWLEKLGAAG